MTVWNVYCHWYQENGYSYCDREDTHIGIFSNLPLAARAALQFVDCMNRNQTRISIRVITGVWCDSIDISEYDYHFDESYEYATIRFEKVTLDEGVLY